MFSFFLGMICTMALGALIRDIWGVWKQSPEYRPISEWPWPKFKWIRRRGGNERDQ